MLGQPHLDDGLARDTDALGLPGQGQQSSKRGNPHQRALILLRAARFGQVGLIFYSVNISLFSFTLS